MFIATDARRRSVVVRRGGLILINTRQAEFRPADDDDLTAALGYKHFTPNGVAHPS